MADKVTPPPTLTAADLAAYKDRVEAVQQYLAEHVHTPADIERELREFDDEQRKLWAEHIDKGKPA
jgi:hypothetical protein